MANNSNNILQSIFNNDKLFENVVLIAMKLEVCLNQKKELYVLNGSIPEEEPPSNAYKVEKDV